LPKIIWKFMNFRKLRDDFSRNSLFYPEVPQNARLWTKQSLLRCLLNTAGVAGVFAKLYKF